MRREPTPTIAKLSLENFCGFSKYELDLMPLTVLIGPNNGGKTTVLRAIKFLIDFLQLVMPQYSGKALEFAQNLQNLERDKTANLAKFEEARTSALRDLAEDTSLENPMRTRKKLDIKNEYVENVGQAKRKFEQRLAKLMGNRPRCTCDVSSIAQRQSVKSMVSFFFRHAQEHDAILNAEFAATPAPTNLTLTISRQSRNNYLASGSLLVQGKPIWELDDDIRTAALQCLKAVGCNFIQPISYLCPSESDLSYPNVESTLNQGRPHDVWRNQFRWLAEGKTPAAFQRVIQATRQAMPSVGVIMPRRTRDSTPKIMVEFEEEGTTYEVAESGNGLRTLLSIVACLELSDAPICLFDEPDSHLHSAVQRELAHFITGSANPDRQVILATHAPDMIDQLPLESQIWIDRRESAGRQCDDATAALVDLGAIAHTEALESAGGPLLLFEAKPDKKAFQALCSKLGDTSWLAECRLSTLGGYGDTKHLRHMARVVQEHYDPGFRIAAIRDSDYSYPESPIGEPEQGTLICYLPCKELENLLLLQPEALATALRDVADNAQSYNAETLPIPDAAQIDQYVDEITQQERIRNTVCDPWIIRKMPTNHPDGAHHRQAREGFEQFWGDKENRVRFCPGKQVLAELRRRVQAECKLTLPSLPRLFEFYEPSDDLRQIIEAVKEHLTSPSDSTES